MERGNTTAETLEQREALSPAPASWWPKTPSALPSPTRKWRKRSGAKIQVRLARTEIKARPPARSAGATPWGALASSAGDPLFRIIGAGTIEVEADVPEISLARLRVGQTALVRPAGMEQPVPARVRLVSPEVNRTSRLGRVRLSVDPVPGLAVGAFARGTVEVDRRDGTLVPLSAVLYRPDGPIVQVVRDGIVETRPSPSG